MRLLWFVAAFAVLYAWVRAVDAGIGYLVARGQDVADAVMPPPPVVPAVFTEAPPQRVVRLSPEPIRHDVCWLQDGPRDGNGEELLQ